jgi:inward rectifier potassium channel
MTKPVKPAPELTYSIEVVGARRPEVSDLYHALLRMAWWQALAVIVGVYLALNLLFAALFVAVGGVEKAQPGSFVDAFFFSVQTFGTIGYGVMYPATRAANAIVVVESIASLITTALATGLIFVRFSLTKGRIVFGEKVAVGPMDGVPTLMIRLGNDRSNQIYDAQMRITMMTTTRTAEGVKWYRSVDLPLVRDRAAALSRSWTILHRIDDTSPLKNATPASLKVAEAELTVSVSGVDETSMQVIHARHIYEHFTLSWGTRLADVLSETPDGNMILDLRRFHDVVPTEPTAAFPFPADLAS